MRSIDLCAEVLALLLRAGVREFCLCPGRRNAPFVVLLEVLTELHPEIRVYSFFDERAAGFFALGRSRALRRMSASPLVPVVTTSGTACAELLPAAIEGWYSGDPLVLVTSDRPRRLRGSGAPQAIEQVGLYSHYVSSCSDIEALTDIPSEELFENKPLQLNVCFDEPVLTGDRTEWLSLINEKLSPLLKGTREVSPAHHSPGIVGEPSVVGEFLKKSERPLVVVGALCPPDAPVVAQFLSCLGAPVWAEASSQLLSVPELQPLLLRSGNGFVRKLFDQRRFDGVLRIGGVPSPRVWRDLDERLSHVPVCVISERPFLGLERGELVAGPLPSILSPLIEAGNLPSYTLAHDIREADDVRRAGIAELLGRYPKSEVGMLAQIAEQIPARAQVYLGNSLPIREWEIATASGGPEQALYGVSRGANGIDGQISTFLGWISHHQESDRASEAWAIVGDLTALYDLNAFWALRYLNQAPPLRVIILNNGGGQIFSRMFSSRMFLNEHDTSFSGLGEMWGLTHQAWTGVGSVPTAASDSLHPNLLLLEARPCDTQSAEFWRDFERLV